MLRHGEAVVDAGELDVLLEEDLAVSEIQVGGFGVDFEACKGAGDGLWDGSVAFCVGPPEEDVLGGDGEVDD